MAFRAFIAADVGTGLDLDAFGRALRDTGGRLKVLNLGHLHATLKFLGDVDEALVPEVVSVMEKSVAGVAPTTVTLRGTGVYPSPRRINVIWVGMEGAEPLAGIAAVLNRELEALGVRREGRPWSPHVTVARVKGGHNLDRVRAAVEAFSDTTFGAARVDRIRLKRSVLTPQGPEYSTVAEALLRG